jgi:hypothetical protein
MSDKKHKKAKEFPKPEILPEKIPVSDPEEPIAPEIDPNVIPDEDPFENPPFEIPEPGEGP